MGAVTRVEVRRAVAEIAWGNLFRRGANRCFQRLALYGLTGKVELPAEADAPAKPRATVDPPRRVAPCRLAACAALDGRPEGRFHFQCGNDFVRLQEALFRVSELEPGVFKAGHVVVQQPWLQKSFRNVRGTTARQDSKVLLANLELAPGVVIKSFSTDLAELARGRLQQEIQVRRSAARSGRKRKRSPKIGAWTSRRAALSPRSTSASWRPFSRSPRRRAARSKRASSPSAARRKTSRNRPPASASTRRIFSGNRGSGIRWSSARS